MSDKDHSEQLQTAVQAAISNKQPIQLRAGGSKDFYGRTPHGEVLQVNEHSGIMQYEPSELVITARAGTPLREIEQTLADNNQMLAFEPPHLGENATLGGTIACGLSGPRRPFTGSARDYVLGTRVINGHGEIVSFGGQVMKNVAGYDISRLMTGSLGTLGLLLDVSLKVLPKPEAELTLMREANAEKANELLSRWSGRALCLSAGCYDGERLFVRLSGAESAVLKIQKHLGAEPYVEGEQFWQDVREQQRPFFQHEGSLWRISLPAATAPLNLPGRSLWDWAGAQRWVVYKEPDEEHIRTAATNAGGHAHLFRNGNRDAEVFQALPAPLHALQKRIKHAMDPAGIFNPGRLYSDW